MSLNANDFARRWVFRNRVTIITVDQDATRVHGMTANAFTRFARSVLVLVCVDHRRNPRSSACAKALWSEVLRSDQQSVSEYYPLGGNASASPRGGARFDRTATEHLCCKSFGLSRVPVALDATRGDHTIFIAEVEEVVVRDGNHCSIFAASIERSEVRGEIAKVKTTNRSDFTSAI